MKTIKIFIAASALAWGFSCAEAQEATGPYKASELRLACYALTLKSNNEGPILAMAEGLCMGAISTALRFGPMMNDQFRFCPPPSLSPTDAIPIILRFIDANPKAQNLDLRDVANYVGRVTWPCK